MPVRGSVNFWSFLPFTENGDQLPGSDSDLDEEGCRDVDDSVSLSISRELQDGIGQIAIQPQTTQENLNSSKRH